MLADHAQIGVDQLLVDRVPAVALADRASRGARFGANIGTTVTSTLVALGLFLLPDALSRQHAATKSATLALGLLLAALFILGFDSGSLRQARSAVIASGPAR